MCGPYYCAFSHAIVKSNIGIYICKGAVTIVQWVGNKRNSGMIGLGTARARRYTQQGEPGAGQVAITSEQIRAARALLRWEQTDLAEASGLAVVTIQTIERRPGPLMIRTSSLYKLQEAFKRVGVEFLDEDNGGPGVRMRGRRR